MPIVSEQVGGTTHAREEGPTPMSAQQLMPMHRTVNVVAPAYPRPRASWLRAMAPVSAGVGFGGSPFVCVTTGTDLDQATDINTKAHGARRLLETST